MTDGHRDIVVIDSTEVIADYWMGSPDWRTVLALAQAGERTVVVPEMVVLECESHFREALREGANKVAAVGLGRLLGRARARAFTIDVEGESAAYSSHLRELLQRHGVVIDPVPDVASLDLARRLTDRGRPFRRLKGGTTGLGDVYIWETVLRRAAAGGEVVFVTGNKTDFAGEDGSLHGELEKAVPAGARVIRLPNLAAYVVQLPEDSARTARAHEIVTELVATDAEQLRANMEIAVEQAHADLRDAIGSAEVVGAKILNFDVQRVSAARIDGLEDLASVYFTATADVRLDVYGMGPTINDGDAVAVLVNRQYDVVVHGLLDLSDRTIDALSVEGDLIVYLSDVA